MKNAVQLLICFLVINLTFGQTPSKEYYDLVKKADSLYKIKDYKNSAFAYTTAFKTFGGYGLIDDRYIAACSWSMAGYSDSAFYNLNRIVKKVKYSYYDKITTEPFFIPLHTDDRWQPLIDTMKRDKEKAEANLNLPLIHRLDSIYYDDQHYRSMIDSISMNFGNESKEMREIWPKINYLDSINQVKVIAIINQYGWLGKDIIGEKGNTTLFLVIQHSELKTQEYYLPIMKEAVENGNAKASNLAYLIDRIEIRNGRPQIYGSQLKIIDGKYVPLEIKDKENVDKRRVEVGLGPLEDFLHELNDSKK